jgi:hypothetical protein
VRLSVIERLTDQNILIEIANDIKEENRNA